MKKILAISILFSMNNVFAANPSELSKCVLAYWRASGMMASAGNIEQQKNFGSAATSFLEAGNRVFGQQSFSNYLEGNKQLIKSMNQDDLLGVVQRCNTQGPSYAK